MQAREKRNALFVILAVSALTLYNILPTIFFYSNDLKAPITLEKSTQIAKSIGERVNNLEGESIAWINSYCKLLHIKASKISLRESSPDLIEITFKTEKEARMFKNHMLRANELISFFPKRMTPVSNDDMKNILNESYNPKIVTLSREIPLHFDLNKMEKYFSFVEMYDKDGLVTPAYREVLDDRVTGICKGVLSESSTAANIEKAQGLYSKEQKVPFFMAVAESILNYKTIFENNPALLKKFYGSMFNSPSSSKSDLYNLCLQGFQLSLDSLIEAKVLLKEEIKKGGMDENDQTLAEISSLGALSKKETTLLDVITILKAKKSTFISKNPEVASYDLSSEVTNKKIEGAKNYTLSTGDLNPVISSIFVDYKEGTVSIEILKELLDFTATATAVQQRKINQLVFDEIAKVKNLSGEEIQKSGLTFSINLSGEKGAKSFLQFNLKEVAAEKISSLKTNLETFWDRSSETLSKENYKIFDWNGYKALEEQDKHFTLTFYSPLLDGKNSVKGFKNGSIYIIGKDILSLYNKISQEGFSEENSKIHEDLSALNSLIGNAGVTTYPGNVYPFGKEFKDDIIFEVTNFYESLLSATREDWKVMGSGKLATLAFSDVRNRILAVNNIENKEHADLLKWNDDYHRARANPEAEGHMSIPAPTKSPFFSNLALSTSKYFRGDERKILHWGLDMAGGTAVRLALKDKQNKAVKNEADINQGINELYRRVNKMGVSDVAIRKEGSFITMDFPATQSLSASELISSSSMTFHIVNEKFSMHNEKIRLSVNRFLQEVWNEAVVRGKTDAESIHQIAFIHLYGDEALEADGIARSDSGRVLLENGLRLAHPNAEISSDFNDEISKIAVMDGDGYADWNGMAHPLVFVFNNYALEGSSLNSITSGYDPSSGNYLSFSVNSEASGEKGVKVDPRNVLYTWTSVFSTSQMSDTKYSEYTGGGGWRLSAILNGRIISMPRLNDALKDNGRISGSFTQKEVAKLAADLKAGSLTYTPEIISETTISPELGSKERAQGLFATLVAFVAVLVIMIGYYRFAGVIASIAVVFNILIIWATLQNLGASLTLAGIAGIILTIGMAVDANVLIYERMREEFENDGNIIKAISTGYQKAFSAIFDSNITTIIAALILLNFDAGPVKGFALTLIIGITSSMFTALYMTRTFFNYWQKKDKKQTLTMLNLIPNSGIAFMKYGRLATILSVIIIIIGGVTLYEQRQTLFGMDFTGGTTLEIEVVANQAPSPKAEVEKALLASGMKQDEFSLRELDTASHLKVYLSNSLTNAGRPFANLQARADFDNLSYSYEKNPKLTYFVGLLNKSGVILTEKSLTSLDKNFSNISGQMSATMRNNALFGLTLALLSILIYITVRFEFSYALAATIGLVFDLLLTLAMLGICKLIGVQLTVDLQTIAALMTIIGYSLNDTIIVFDRIRSDLKVKKTQPLVEVINEALNKTLSRTMMTSLTTLVVLLSLVILGGKSIFNFSFLMMMGVIIGTFSSLYIASTFLLLFKHKEKKASKSASIISIHG